jgi:hypothetical protein
MKQYIGGTKREQNEENKNYLTIKDIRDAINSINSVGFNAGVYSIDSTITINPHTIISGTETMSGTFTTSYIDPSIFTTFQKPNPKYIGGYKVQQ